MARNTERAPTVLSLARNTVGEVKSGRAGAAGGCLQLQRAIRGGGWLSAGVGYTPERVPRGGGHSMRVWRCRIVEGGVNAIYE